jgi:hypothetical protein
MEAKASLIQMRQAGGTRLGTGVQFGALCAERVPHHEAPVF